MRLLCVAVLVLVGGVADAQPRGRHATTRRVRPSLPAQERVTTVAPVTVEKQLPPGVTLVQGAVLVNMTLEMSVAKTNAGVPASLAPDVSAGVTNDLTLSLVHSGSALTGFRGGAGAGFCFTGEGPGKCKSSYAGGGFEALYGLVRGPIAVGANGGLLVTSVDPRRMDVKVGFKSKATLGRTSLVFNPSVWLALDARNDAMAPHEDQLLLPLGIVQKVTTRFSVGAGTGLRGPLKHLGTQYAIPAGVILQFALDPHVTFGSSLVFGRIVGGSDIMNPEPGLDSRALQLWLSVASR
ncbi:MAG TPA: hypothetical protein VMZ53_32365 [Kofleriaceae bacterium]|nr:hypothetical protein [Kofleriaceae bacterium]